MSNHPRRRRPPAPIVGRRGLPRPVPYDVDELGSWIVENGPTPTERRRLDEWQFAADAAATCLAIDACRFFGLITGGPKVNAERCAQVLDQAERRGVTPSDDAVERFLPAFMVGDA